MSSSNYHYNSSIDLLKSDNTMNILLCSFILQVETVPNAEHMSPSGKMPVLYCGKFFISELMPIVNFIKRKVWLDLLLILPCVLCLLSFCGLQSDSRSTIHIYVKVSSNTVFVHYFSALLYNMALFSFLKFDYFVFRVPF